MSSLPGAWLSGLPIEFSCSRISAKVTAQPTLEQQLAFALRYGLPKEQTGHARADPLLLSAGSAGAEKQGRFVRRKA